jgi:hypothetical protein
MAVGFRGSSSSGGSSGGVDFDDDYFNVPIVPLGTLNSIPGFANDLTGGGSTPSNNTFDAAAFNQSYDAPVIDPAMYGSSIMDRSEGPPMLSEPSYFTTDKLTEQDIQNYLNDTEGFVYNPGTNKFEAAGDYTYPLSKIAPGYSDTQEKFMSGIKPGMTGEQLRNIELNRLNTQKLAFEAPMGEGLNMFDDYNTAYTGFTPDGTFVGTADNPVGPVFDYDGDGSYEPAPGNSAFEPGPDNSGGK